MTYIHPNQAKNLLNRILFCLVLVVTVMAISLIVIYSRAVNFSYEISKSESDIKEIQAESAGLQGRIFSIASGDNLEKLASQRGLVQEKNPQYLEIGSKSQWVFVSAR